MDEEKLDMDYVPGENALSYLGRMSIINSSAMETTGYMARDMVHAFRDDGQTLQAFLDESVASINDHCKGTLRDIELTALNELVNGVMTAEGKIDVRYDMIAQSSAAVTQTLEDGTVLMPEDGRYDELRDVFDRANVSAVNDVFAKSGFMIGDLDIFHDDPHHGPVQIFWNASEDMNSNLLVRAFTDNSFQQSADSFGDLAVKIYHFCKTTDFDKRAEYCLSNIFDGETMYDGFKLGGNFVGDKFATADSIRFEGYPLLESQATELAKSMREFVKEHQKEDVVELDMDDVGKSSKDRGPKSR